jgi:CubicO group peptidase (beta-lactamase class C family)
MINISRGILIVALAIGAVTLEAGAQTDEISGRVDDFVRAAIRQQRIPGLALAVMRDGQVIKAQGYGLSNIELNAPVNPQTVCQSGSVGKQFTATGS